MPTLLNPEYRVKLRVEFTRAEIERLVDQSGKHYDAHCRSVSVPGRGSFLNAWKNRLEEGENTATVTTDFSELDTCAKILEQDNTSEGAALYWFCHQQLKAINTLFCQVNGKPDPYDKLLGTKPKERMTTVDTLTKLKLIYDSEINITLSTFWDAGYNWRLGNDYCGFLTSGSAETFEQAVDEIIAAAITEYPKSDLAKVFAIPHITTGVELGIDGNCGYALLGKNLQVGEAEFEEVGTYLTNGQRSAELTACFKAFYRLRDRLNQPDIDYHFGPLHPYMR